MAELFLDVAFIDIGAGGKTRAQRVAGVEAKARGFRKVGAQASGFDAGLDQAGDVFVRETFGGGFAAIAGDGDEDRAEIDAGEVQPLRQGMDRAGLIGGAAGDFKPPLSGVSSRP